MGMKISRCLLAFTALGFLGVRGVCEDTAQPEKVLPRFHEVAPGIYRGGQPTRVGFDLLKQRGVRTIINLRREKDEKELVEGLGLKYVYIPLDTRDEVSANAIKTFLTTVSDPASQPVFVHCHRGADRTGLMVGLYRIAQQGWSAQQAYDEARGVGMRWWYRGLKRQLYEFAEKTTSLQPSTSGQ